MESGPRAGTAVVGTEISMGGYLLKGKKSKKGGPEAVDERAAQQKWCLACIVTTFVSLSHLLSLPGISAAAAGSP